MDYSTSKSRYILTALAIILVITAFILIGLNALQIQNRIGFGKASLGSGTYTDGYIAGYKAARAFDQRFCPLLGQSATVMSGIVEQVSGDKLKVRQTSLDVNPQIDGVDDLRTILTTSSTRIERAPQNLLQELKKISPGQAPKPFRYETVSFSEIKAGQTVTIESATDLRLAPTITATVIRVK